MLFKIIPICNPTFSPFADRLREDLCHRTCSQHSRSAWTHDKHSPRCSNKQTEDRNAHNTAKTSLLCLSWNRVRIQCSRCIQCFCPDGGPSSWRGDATILSPDALVQHENIRDKSQRWNAPRIVLGGAHGSLFVERYSDTWCTRALAQMHAYKLCSLMLADILHNTRQARACNSTPPKGLQVARDTSFVSHSLYLSLCCWRWLSLLAT